MTRALACLLLAALLPLAARAEPSDLERARLAYRAKKYGQVVRHVEAYLKRTGRAQLLSSDDAVLYARSLVHHEHAVAVAADERLAEEHEPSPRALAIAYQALTRCQGRVQSARVWLLIAELHQLECFQRIYAAGWSEHAALGACRRVIDLLETSPDPRARGLMVRAAERASLACGRIFYSVDDLTVRAHVIAAIARAQAPPGSLCTPLEQLLVIANATRTRLGEGVPPGTRRRLEWLLARHLLRAEDDLVPGQRREPALRALMAAARQSIRGEPDGLPGLMAEYNRRRRRSAAWVGARVEGGQRYNCPHNTELIETHRPFAVKTAGPVWGAGLRVRLIEMAGDQARVMRSRRSEVGDTIRFKRGLPPGRYRLQVIRDRDGRYLLDRWLLIRPLAFACLTPPRGPRRAWVVDQRTGRGARALIGAKRDGDRSGAFTQRTDAFGRATLARAIRVGEARLAKTRQAVEINLYADDAIPHPPSPAALVLRDRPLRAGGSRLRVIGWDPITQRPARRGIRLEGGLPVGPDRAGAATLSVGQIGHERPSLELECGGRERYLRLQREPEPPRPVQLFIRAPDVVRGKIWRPRFVLRMRGSGRPLPSTRVCYKLDIEPRDCGHHLSQPLDPVFGRGFACRPQRELRSDWPPGRRWAHSVLSVGGEGFTDSRGELVIQLPAWVDGHPDVALRLSAWAVDERGETLASAEFAAVRVKSRFLLGLDLPSRVGPEGTDLQIEAVDLRGRLAPGRHSGVLRVIHQRPRASLFVERVPFTLIEGRARVVWRPAQPGRYQLSVVVDDDWGGQAKVTTATTVVSPGQELVLPASGYLQLDVASRLQRPGEPVDVLLRTPFASGQVWLATQTWRGLSEPRLIAVRRHHAWIKVGPVDPRGRSTLVALAFHRGRWLQGWRHLYRVPAKLLRPQVQLRGSPASGQMTALIRLRDARGRPVPGATTWVSFAQREQPNAFEISCASDEGWIQHVVDVQHPLHLLRVGLGSWWPKLALVPEPETPTGYGRPPDLAFHGLSSKPAGLPLGIAGSESVSYGSWIDDLARARGRPPLPVSSPVQRVPETWPAPLRTDRAGRASTTLRWPKQSGRWYVRVTVATSQGQIGHAIVPVDVR